MKEGCFGKCTVVTAFIGLSISTTLIIVWLGTVGYVLGGIGAGTSILAMICGVRNCKGNN